MTAPSFKLKAVLRAHKIGISTLPLVASAVFLTLAYLGSASQGAPTTEQGLTDPSAPVFRPMRDYWYRLGDVPTKTDTVALEKYAAAHPGNAEALFWLSKAVQRKFSDSKEDAMALLSRAAGLGFLPARSEVAAREATGVGLPQDISSGMAGLLSAAKEGDSNAARHLGEILGSGRYGVTKDEAKGEEFLKMAVKLGDGEANWSLYLLYQQEGNYEAAIRAAKEGGEAGDPLSMQALYEAYKAGSHVTADAGSAVYWLKKLASQRHSLVLAAKGSKDLADLVARGDYGGLEKDDARAILLYKTSAGFGNMDSKRLLAMTYQIGALGVMPDPKAAVWLWQDLAANGDAKGEMFLGRLYLEGVLVERDDEKGRKLIEEAASKGLAEAQMYLRLIRRGSASTKPS